MLGICAIEMFIMIMIMMMMMIAIVIMIMIITIIVIVSITKCSIVIGSLRAYLIRNWRVNT